jgi:hypothetical protein
METPSYKWKAGAAGHELRLVLVAGTAGDPYLFGAGPKRHPIEIRDFYMMSTPSLPRRCGCTSWVRIL